jgi:soluble lytic murein transglycosylase
VAAVALKNAAQNAAALGEHDQARQLWQTLLHRFRGSTTSADALYALGRRRPALRAELMRRFPAHPAALAAALEAGPAPADRLAGALHLARWGARWPGAAERLGEACRSGPLRPTAAQRASLAAGIAQLGDGDGALACLGGDGGDPARAAAASQLSAAGRLDLGRALLQGKPEQHPQALALLLEAARQGGGPGGGPPEAEDAVRLLAQQDGAEAQKALESLPEAWQVSAPVATRRVLADPKAAGALAVLRRWPDDPASWELQWELARRQLLAGQWDAAATLLGTIPAERLPAPLAARSRFWLGMIQRQQGDESAAAATWRDLRRQSPGGYYGWRAAVQLGEADHIGAGQPTGGASGGGHGTPADADRPNDWQPLASGDPLLDQLWRLDQRDEAWETWRAARPPARRLSCWWRAGCGRGWETTGPAWANWNRRACASGPTSAP